jgi:hypothetical protein
MSFSNCRNFWTNNRKRSRLVTFSSSYWVLCRSHQFSKFSFTEGCATAILKCCVFCVQHGTLLIFRIWHGKGWPRSAGPWFSRAQFPTLQQGRCSCRRPLWGLGSHRPCWRVGNWTARKSGPDLPRISFITSDHTLTATYGLSRGSGACIPTPTLPKFRDTVNRHASRRDYGACGTESRAGWHADDRVNETRQCRVFGCNADHPLPSVKLSVNGIWNNW